MPVKYICISDLHLGAEYSLLTGIDHDGNADHEAPCPTLNSFSSAMNELLDNLSVNKETRLVLLGDVLDMGFSDTPHVIRAFKRFAEIFLLAENVKKISSQLLYIPGNHDHQLWQEEKNNHLLGQILAGENDDSLKQATNLIRPEYLESQLLSEVIHQISSLDELSVQIAYPNFGDANERTGVVFHHGHYTESTYLLISKLKQALLGDTSLSSDISVIERENGYLINFLWSNLGNAGFGSEFLDLYETMLDAGASHEFIVRSSKQLKNYLTNRFGLSDNTLSNFSKHLTIDRLIRVMLDATFQNFSSAERYSFLSVMSESGIQGLEWYLSGPVYRQFVSEKVTPPKELSFIFGHTHKPFQDLLPVEGFDLPVKVFNTGGWAIDKPVLSAHQGAAVVFVDDQFNVASLRLYNCSNNRSVPPPMAAGAGGDNSNPMLSDLEAALSKTNWIEFTENVNTAIDVRQRNALHRYFDPATEHGVLEREVGL